MFRAEVARLRARAIVAAAVIIALSPGAARAQTKAPKPRSKQEEQRRQLLEKMGLEKNDVPPAPPPAPVVPDTEAPDERVEATGPARPGAPATPAAPSFRRAVHPLLLQMCKGCHAPGAPAAATALLLTGDPAVDHPSVRKVLDVRAPAASAILVKASGQKLHAGGAPWPVGGPAYARVLALKRRLDDAERPHTIHDHIKAVIALFGARQLFLILLLDPAADQGRWRGNVGID